MQKKTNNNQMPGSFSVEKRFNKRKPNASISNENLNKGEESRTIMSFDMSSKNRFPIYSSKNKGKRNESSNNYLSNSKSKADYSEDKNSEGKRRRLKKTESIDSLKENKPLKVKNYI